MNIALAVAPDIAGFGVLSLELRFTVSRSIAHMGKVTYTHEKENNLYSLRYPSHSDRLDCMGERCIGTEHIHNKQPWAAGCI